MKMNNNESLSKSVKDMMLEEPFYGLFLIGIHREWNNNIPTAGVSKNKIGVKLSINEDFWGNLSKDHRMGLLKHELLHVSFGHMTLRDKFHDHKLFNIAADIEINQYIKPHQLPDGALLPQTFPELKLPLKAGTSEYYKLLQQGQQDNSSPTLQNLTKEMEEGDSPYDHSTWSDFNDLDEAEKKLIEKQVQHQLKEAATEVQKKGRGTVPGELSELINRLFNPEPEKFNWRAYLRRFVGNSSITYTKKLRRKYNKRYIENPGLKIKRKNHVLVGIDTSGSVSTDELKEFMNEIYHISKTGNEVTIIQCDTQIASIEKYNSNKDFQVKGRGGTDFQPVINHYNENKGKYTNLIYLTDGEAPAPKDPPKKLLWVLSSISHETNHLPGLTIKLN